MDLNETTYESKANVLTKEQRPFSFVQVVSFLVFCFKNYHFILTTLFVRDKQEQELRKKKIHYLPQHPKGVPNIQLKSHTSRAHRNIYRGLLQSHPETKQPLNTVTKYETLSSSRGLETQAQKLLL